MDVWWIVALVGGILFGWLILSRIWAPTPADGAASAESEARRLRAELADSEAARHEAERRAADLEYALRELRSRPAPAAPPEAPVPATAGNGATPESATDDLKQIRGIGPVLERALHEHGIMTFKQLAGLDEAGVREIERRLSEFSGRMRRDDWMSQAAALQRERHGP